MPRAYTLPIGAGFGQDLPRPYPWGTRATELVTGEGGVMTAGGRRKGALAYP